MPGSFAQVSFGCCVRTNAGRQPPLKRGNRAHSVMNDIDREHEEFAFA
jgi:hypothetical protein